LSDGRIFVPNAAVVRSAQNFLRPATWPLGRGTTEVEFHPRYCHMQPWVLAALGAWGIEYRSAGGEITVTNAERAAYGWRFGLADYFGIPSPVVTQQHEESGRFVALRTIKTSADLADLLASIVTLLHLADEPQDARAVLYIMSEMVRNVLEHSESPHGAVVAAQYYPPRRTGRRYVSIGVADAGVGVRKTLSRNYSVASHGDALLKAIQPGVTGAVPGQYGSADNAGAGLAMTRSMAGATQGYFALASGSAMFRTSLAQRKPPDHQLVKEIGFFPGTIVCVEIELREDSDFTAVLGTARGAFGEAIQGSSEAVKKVRFS